MAKLDYLTISEAHDMLVQNKTTAVELTNFYITKIRNLNPNLRAVITVCEKEALAQAKLVDQRIAKGETIGQLEGIPYTAKDMFLTKGIRTTAASKILEDYIPPYSATVIEKLNESGAILLAKVNQDEFAHGGSTENSSFHPTHNPWNLDYVPGGSSGGSAAAVAADLGIFSLGTDTGGSIRQPAAYCGVTGYKPTYGLVSRYGVVAMASSFDCIGPITRNAEDARIVLSCIAGQDSADSTTIQSDINSSSQGEVKNVKTFELDSLPEAGDAFSLLNTKGVKVEAESGRLLDESLALATYYILVPSEISSNLERYDGIRYGSWSKDSADLLQTYLKTRGEYFGAEVKRRNMIGTYALSAGYYDAYYKKAMQVRTQIIETFNEYFKDCDLIITPTTIGGAFKFGDKSDPVEMYKTDLLTVAANLAGLPAISIPAGFDESGMPIGMQIIGPQGGDIEVLQLAQIIQAGTDWHNKVKELVI